MQVDRDQREERSLYSMSFTRLSFRDFWLCIPKSKVSPPVNHPGLPYFSDPRVSRKIRLLQNKRPAAYFISIFKHFLQLFKQFQGFFFSNDCIKIKVNKGCQRSRPRTGGRGWTGGETKLIENRENIFKKHIWTGKKKRPKRRWRIQKEWLQTAKYIYIYIYMYKRSISLRYGS